MRKRSAYRPKAILSPAIRLTESHAEDLALQVHFSVLALDSVSGLNRFVRQLTICTVAMEKAKTHCKQSRSVLRTAILRVEQVIKNGIVTESDEAYLKSTAARIDEWVQAGRITYAGLDYARKISRALDCKAHLTVGAAIEGVGNAG